MKFAHTRELLVALPAWLFALVWLWPRAVRADSSLTSEIHTYDWVSVGYAGGLGLLGGAVALLVALATDRRVVTKVLAEGARNAIISPVGGVLAFSLLKIGTALDLVHLTTEPRFAVIVFGGYACIALIEWVRGLVTAAAPKLRDGLVDFLVSWLKKWGAGGAKGE